MLFLRLPTSAYREAFAEVILVAPPNDSLSRFGACAYLMWIDVSHFELMPINQAILSVLI